MLKVIDSQGNIRDITKVIKTEEVLPEYKADRHGTEEILSSGKSVSPILSINYEGTRQEAEFTYRQTGGGTLTEDIEKAKIEKVKGNTIAWNQFAISLNVASEVYGITRERRGNALHYSGTSTNSTEFTGVSTSGNLIDTHKYYFSAKGIPNTCRISMATVIGIDSYVGTFNRTSFGVYIPNGVTINADVYFACIDITLIYGAGNEPSTPKEFEADYQRWFGKPLTYEEYDAGSLRPVNMTGIKSVGFNQWDEEWEIGAIDYNTGVLITDPQCIRTKHYISCFPNTNYYIYSTNTSNIRVAFYDEKYNFVESPNSSLTTNTIYTTLKDVRYLKFYVRISIDPTYLNNICINLSDPTLNGTYVPYKATTVPIPVNTLTGKLNGTGSSVTIFPDGMKRAGNVYDEIKIDNGVVKAVKRVGSVDLGTLTWLIDRNTFRVVSNTTITNSKVFAISQKANILCSRYTTASVNTIISGTQGQGCIGKTQTVSINDSNLYNKENGLVVKESLQGVMLYYELATPEEYVLDIPMKEISVINHTDSNGNIRQVLVGN